MPDLTISLLLQIVQVIGILVAAGIAVITYRRDSNLRQLEWIHRLYERYYENDRFKDVRRRFDHEAETVTLGMGGPVENIDRHEALVDYLNFFEFIASQVRRKRIKRRDVMDVFEYYIRDLQKRETLKAELAPNGFENLRAFLERVETSK